MSKILKSAVMVLATVLTWMGEAAAVPYHYFTRFNSDSGLPNNTIISCHSDSRGFLWVGTKDGLYRFDGHDFMVPDQMLGSEMNEGMIGAVCEDRDGDIWFSSSKGVGLYHPVSGKVDVIESMKGIMCYRMAADDSGNIWLLHNDIWSKGLDDCVVYRYDKKTGSTVSYPISQGNIQAIDVAIDTNHNVWFNAEGSPYLYRYDAKSDKFEQSRFQIDGKQNSSVITHIESAADGKLIVSTENRDVYLVNALSLNAEFIYRIGKEANEIRTLLERDTDEYWIGTAAGIYIITDGNAEHLDKIASDSHSLSGGDIWCMTKGSKGNVWIGTFYNGLNLWQNSANLFSVLYENPSSNSIRGQFIRALCPDEVGNLWIGTEDGGLNCMNQIDRSVVNYSIFSDNGNKINIQGLAVKGDDLWIATYEDGVIVFDINTRKVRKHYYSPLENATIRTLPHGEIVVGSRNGLYEYVEETDSFEHRDEIGNYFIHTMLVDSRDHLWVGTYGSGLFLCGKKGEQPRRITVNDTERGLSSDFITSLYEDSRHRIWITTEGGGLSMVPLDDVVSGTFRFSTLKRSANAGGLTSNVTSAVAEDEQGNIWVSTSRGIVQIDPDTMDINEVFLKSSRIIGEQYSYGACYTARNGDIYFGTAQGLFRFSPTRIISAMKDIPIYITEIKANRDNRSIFLHSPDKSTIESDVIRIRHKDISSLDIRYSASDLSLPQAVVYSYGLTHRGWQNKGMTTSNHVSFVDIKPGRYTFSINRLGDEDDNFRTIELIVTPPFYESILAYIFYIILFSAAIFAIARMALKRRDAIRQQQTEKLEDRKKQEIYKAKLNFFTNITHEIRTPLTLIKMPLDKIISKGDYTETSKKELVTMQENANRLLTLTNQILDMRKMDKNETQLRYVRKDIATILRRIYSTFEMNARDQHLTISHNIPEEAVMIPCAEDVVTTVMSNLLSNAVKYCQNTIEVIFEELSDKIRIRVNSNGKRIPAQESEKIFEMFYQLGDSDDSVRRSQGTGLGLPYAKSMAKLHNGDLFLDSKYPGWNSFVFDIPKEQESHIEVVKNDIVEDAGTGEEKDSNLHFILVVEDDPDLRKYISNELSDEYNTVTAANGEDALKIIQNQRIDLVVSDVMMPVMDGCELCNTIKSSTDYSHIPVILLTAAVGIETRMETLQAGADGYIEKPFSMDLLRANVANLFKNRDIAYRQFVNSPLTHYNSVTVSNVDQKYMDKLHEVIISNLSNHDLNVDTLADMLSTSKSTLYRKVKGNTGLNINEYIRLCRLKQAAEMLSSQKYRVNEVADLVGFSSPSYFATSFQKQFNISPSNFVKQLRGEE